MYFYAIISKGETAQRVELLQAQTHHLATTEALNKAKTEEGGLIGLYTESDMEELLNEVDFLSKMHKGTMIYGLAKNGERLNNGKFWDEWQQEENIFFYPEVITLLESARNIGL